MEKIEVYGTGCSRCRELFERVEKLVKGSGQEVALEKVSDPMRILKARIAAFPAIAIDGKVVLSGRVPDTAELKALLSLEK